MPNLTEIDEVKKAMHDAKDRRHFERYQAVYLYLTGSKIKEIARIIGRIPETAGIYIATYKDHGLEGLTLNHSTGRPSVNAILKWTVIAKQD